MQLGSLESTQGTSFPYLGKWICEGMEGFRGMGNGRIKTTFRALLTCLSVRPHRVHLKKHFICILVPGLYRCHWPHLWSILDPSPHFWFLAIKMHSCHSTLAPPGTSGSVLPNPPTDQCVIEMIRVCNKPDPWPLATPEFSRAYFSPTVCGAQGNTSTDMTPCQQGDEIIHDIYKASLSIHTFDFWAMLISVLLTVSHLSLKYFGRALSDTRQLFI